MINALITVAQYVDFVIQKRYLKVHSDSVCYIFIIQLVRLNYVQEAIVWR